VFPIVAYDTPEMAFKLITIANKIDAIKNICQSCHERMTVIMIRYRAKKWRIWNTPSIRSTSPQKLKLKSTPVKQDKAATAKNAARP
jgi:5-methylcytosine-specific restriction endonuclease McrA